jgi:hypothetical protein
VISVAAALLVATPCEARMPNFFRFSQTTTTATTVITTETTLYHGDSANLLYDASVSALEGNSAVLADAEADMSSTMVKIEASIGSKERPIVRAQSSILTGLEVPLPEDQSSSYFDELALAVSGDDVQQDTLDFFSLDDSVPFNDEIVEFPTTRNIDDLVQFAQQQLSWEGLAEDSWAQEALADPNNSQLTVTDEEMLLVYQALDRLNAGEALESLTGEEVELGTTAAAEIVRGFKPVKAAAAEDEEPGAWNGLMQLAKETFANIMKGDRHVGAVGSVGQAADHIMAYLEKAAGKRAVDE